MHVEPVTKRDAANRQLNQAIRLFFARGDMLSVHSLTAAAFQLYADLGRESGIVSRFRSEELIRPERMREWVNALNATQNFLKHADRDGDETLSYVEEGTMLLLYEALELADRVVPTNDRERLAIRIWFVFSFPEMIVPEKLAALRALNTFGIDQTDRELWTQFLNHA